MNDDNTAIQQNLLNEQEKIELLDKYKTQHKKAFRIAFDFLDLHFPPQNTAEWWTIFHSDIEIAAVQNENNELCQQLLYAILYYMEKVVKNEDIVNGHS